jgi:hypothetical protein
MKPKQLLFQVYLPIRGRSHLYDFCTQSAVNYCKKYDIDYMVTTGAKLKILPNMNRTNRNKNGLMKEAGCLPIFEKSQAFQYLGEYDQIAVIDADIYIRESAPNIFDELTEEYQWGGVQERDLPLTGSHKSKIQGYSKVSFKHPAANDVDWDWDKDGIAGFMNMGMMIFNSSIKEYMPEWEHPENFIMRKEFADFVDGVGPLWHSTDQILLNYWLRKYKINVKRMDWRWNGMYRGARDEKIKEAHFVHFFLKDQISGKGENIDQIKKILGL